MKRLLFVMCLLVGAPLAAYAQQTADAERTGWYASNPWMLAVIIIPVVALLAVGAMLLMRRKL